VLYVSCHVLTPHIVVMFWYVLLAGCKPLLKKNTEILIRHPQVHIEWNFEQNISHVTVRVSFQQLHCYTKEDDLQLNILQQVQIILNVVFAKNHPTFSCFLNF